MLRKHLVSPAGKAGVSRLRQICRTRAFNVGGNVVAAVISTMAIAAPLSFADAAYGAQPPAGPVITQEVTAQQSTDLGMSPSHVGNNFNYVYTVFDGESVDDHLPIQFCLNSITQDQVPWISVTYEFNAPGGDLPGVTNPADVMFTEAADGDVAPPAICKSASITISTGALALADPNIAEVHKSNINISVDGEPTGQSKLTLNPTNAPVIHIEVNVLPAESNDNIACYMTDSSGLLLTDCEGLPVTESGSFDGRFAIVTNKKGKAVATNPGQFYYNVTWLNSTGSQKTVDVAFLRDGLVAQGTQAIHAAVFPPPFSGITQADFDIVNESIPGGSDDLIENIVVPDGWTLWVNYHLEWDGLGSPVPVPCTNDCELADAEGIPISVSAHITDGDSVDEICEAGAWGYLKK